MKINNEKVLNELIDKWDNKPCPFCGGNWIVSNKIFKISEYKNESLINLDNLIQPVVPITCDNCGNTVLVNPLVLKAIKGN